MPPHRADLTDPPPSQIFEINEHPTFAKPEPGGSNVPSPEAQAERGAGLSREAQTEVEPGYHQDANRRDLPRRPKGDPEEAGGHSPESDPEGAGVITQTRTGDLPHRPKGDPEEQGPSVALNRGRNREGFSLGFCFLQHLPKPQKRRFVCPSWQGNNSLTRYVSTLEAKTTAPR